MEYDTDKVADYDLDQDQDAIVYNQLMVILIIIGQSLMERHKTGVTNNLTICFMNKARKAY